MDGLCKDHRPSNRFCEILCLIFLDGRFQIFMLPEKLAENFLLGLFKVIRGQEFKKGQIMANLILMVFTEISRQRKQYITPPLWELTMFEIFTWFQAIDLIMYPRVFSIWYCQSISRRSSRVSDFLTIPLKSIESTPRKDPILWWEIFCESTLSTNSNDALKVNDKNFSYLYFI